MKPSVRILTKQLILVAISVFFSTILFLLSYQYDNKYQSSAPQPIGGILFYNPQTMPVTHLINGWQYYGGKLLTPSDFDEKPLLPDGYVSIGQYPGMEAGQDILSPHGSASYRLILALPDTPATYTMELPEIYSAYRLYINETEVSSRGIPEQEHYKAQIQTGSITFEASGNTSILLAVSDWSYLYSGLVYPPAFGSSQPVLQLLDEKFALTLAVTVLALLLGLIQVVLFIIIKNRCILLSGMICMAFAATVCPPAIHRLYALGIVPFYNIELFSRYAIFGLSVLLANRLYGEYTWLRKAVTALAIVFPAVALWLPLAAPALSYRQMLLFSSTSGLYKATCACWLLYTAFLITAKKRDSNVNLYLLCGTGVFASSLISDRIFHDFEPIRYGWFSETAGLIYILFISSMMFHESFRIYKEHTLLAQQKQYLEHQIQMQKKHYKELSGQIETIRMMRHDIRHHFTQLSLLLQTQAYKDAKDYLEHLNEEVLKTGPLSFCDNYAIDILLRYYHARAEEEHIPVSIHAALPAKVNIPPEDLTIILGNILENALEANLRIPEKMQFFSITIVNRSDNILIKVSNAFNGEFETDGTSYFSAKEEGRLGIGLSSVRSIVEKHSGDLWFECSEEADCWVFTIKILLITGLQ